MGMGADCTLQPLRGREVQMNQWALILTAAVLASGQRSPERVNLRPHPPRNRTCEAL
jgi:hypothetical protein